MMQEKEIIEERIKQQRQQYATIETGIYACGEIIEFRQIDLFDGEMSLMIPDEFIEMPVKFQKVKYPSEYRPQIIMTSLDLSTNLGWTMYLQNAEKRDVKVITESIKNTIKRAYPDYRFFKSGDHREEECPYCWFDFRSYAFDDAVYNIQFIMLIEKKILQGSFNCPYSKAEDWRKVMIQIMKSIKKNGGERS